MIDRRSFVRLLSSFGVGTLLTPFLPQISAWAQHASTQLPPLSHQSRLSSAIDQSDPLAMSEWRDVVTRVDAEELVRRYTTLDTVTENMIHPDHLRGRCPFCHTDWDSLLVYYYENLYGCDACGTEGCVIDFYARIEGVSYREATWRLRALLNAGMLRERLVPNAR